MSYLVLGAGSWGSAIAIHLSRFHPDVYLWAHDKKHIETMKNTRENTRYLPGIIFPENLKLTADFISAEHIIIAVPSFAFKEILLKIKPLMSDKTKLLWITKGLDPESHHFLDQTAREIVGKNIFLSVLSGPSFAKEVAQDMPTAVTIAGDRAWIKLFHSQHFRVYFSDDVVGVQLGGAVKNVLAIAVGVAEGLGCGANAQAALITRGLSEMMRLGVAVGAKPETLMGLSGVGDLILTCTNNQSRNRRFGLLIGQGQSREIAEKSIGQVVEGIQTAKEIYKLSQKYKVEMPITEQVYQLLYENLLPEQALKNLLTREPKSERL